ncbi:MAG: lycopene cyclase family protein [Bacteroidota bacterium]|nr:lycopene cyclase family protein [Bacteroidota bacterium]
MKQYDYIIAGAGAAGLSLLVRFMEGAAFDNKRILVVDKAPKKENDHTWCFWEKQPGIFEPVVHHSWPCVHFFSNYFSSLLNLAPYKYKMIRSIDLYNYVHRIALNHPNVEFIYGNIEAARNEGNTGSIVVNRKQFTANYVFNSVYAKPIVPAGKYYLLQHFKGFVIETNKPVFNPSQATLMDFRVSQNSGTAFVYTLPLSQHRALVEYTLFSKQLLAPEEYVAVLKNYISEFLGVEAFLIAEEEFGVIPMTNLKFEKRVGRVINIGTAGGQTKGSSGYTFQFIQKHSDSIISDLLQHGEVKEHRSFFEKRFSFYDSTLLNILSGDKLPIDKIFSDLFGKNPIERVFRFLDNESNIRDEISLMATLPKKVFVKAGLQEFLK